MQQVCSYQRSITESQHSILRETLLGATDPRDALFIVQSRKWDAHMFSVRSVDHSVIRTYVSQKVNVPLNPQFRNGKGDLEYKVALSDRTRRQSQLGHSIMSGGSVAIYLMKALVRSKPFSSISDINSVNVSPTHILPPRSNVTHWFEYFLTRSSCIVLISLARCSKSFEPACMAAKPPFSSMILRHIFSYSWRFFLVYN